MIWLLPHSLIYPPSPVSKSPFLVFLCVASRAYLRERVGRGGGAAKSFDDEKTWSSINHSMLSHGKVSTYIKNVFPVSVLSKKIKCKPRKSVFLIESVMLPSVNSVLCDQRKSKRRTGEVVFVFHSILCKNPCCRLQCTRRKLAPPHTNRHPATRHLQHDPRRPISTS
jgi:hypothetical protein